MVPVSLTPGAEGATRDDANNEIIPSGSLSYYDDALEDVHTRFILNLPDSELSTSDRIFFQLEQAWWFYEDWICDIHPEYKLPRYTTFKPFARMMFEYSDLLPPVNEFNSMWQQFSAYKKSISNYGCILVTADFQSMVLCQVYNSKTLTFPAGKVNHGEDGPTAAARETYEETGFDPLCQRGLTAQWKELDPSKITWSTMLTEHDMLVYQEKPSTSSDGNNNSSSTSGSGGIGKRRTCYVVVGVPKDFPFEPVCRKEVSDISWYNINSPIPKPSFGVVPFLPQLKRHISKFQASMQQRGNTRSNTPNKNRKSRSNTPNTNSKGSTPKKSRSRANSQGQSPPARKSSSNNNTSANNNRSVRTSRGRTINVIEGDEVSKDLILSGLAKEGDTAGWSEEEMFRVNEKLIGKKCEYDGNPHVFAEQGFGSGIDPHAYHVVGGTFLNQQQKHLKESNVTSMTEKSSSIEATPRRLHQGSECRLQEILKTTLPTAVGNCTSTGASNTDDDEISLKPFFSMDGSTPWGEVVKEVTDLEPVNRSVKMRSNLHVMEPAPVNFNTGEDDVNVTEQEELSSGKHSAPPVVVDPANVQVVGENLNVLDTNLFLTDSEVIRRNKNRSTSTGSGSVCIKSPARSVISPGSNDDGRLSLTSMNHMTTTSIPNSSTTFKLFIGTDNDHDHFAEYQRKQLEHSERRRQLNEQYQLDMDYIQQWVANLPQSKPTKLDADFIMRFFDEAVSKSAA